MKFLYTILITALLLQAIGGNAQIIDLGECKVNELSDTGFHALKKKIGDSRIVVIGEQMQSVGTDYENFAFMTKFLHEEMGFNVIAQEYCLLHFGEVNKQLKKGRSAQEYARGMYWPQGKAAENDLLFNYIDATQKTADPLIMEGFDSRIFLRKKYKSYCDSLLNSTDSKLLKKEKHSEYLSTLDNALRLEYNDTITTAKQQITFLDNIETIIVNMQTQQYSTREIQTIKSFVGFVKNAWNAYDFDMKNADRFYARDKQMAENIFWLADVVYPNEKIILRMHNGHAAKNLHNLKAFIPDSLDKKLLNVGTRLHQRYGDACFHIGH